MPSLPASVEIAIVGAGQAGLTMSWYLQRAGRDHVLLDRRSTLGGGWQDRWDGFRLVGPNWTASFPGAAYDGADPDGYMPRDEILGRVAGYAAAIGAPVVLDADVERLRIRSGGGFELRTSQGSLTAREVVVATGGFHQPRVPAIANALPSRVLSLHAHAYRRAADLPPGAVLVVGSGQTGTQLVEELAANGRDVFLSVGTSGRVPRRYRGQDFFFWLWLMAERGEELGVPLPTVDKLPDPGRRLAGNPSLSGHDGGHETDLRRFGAEGTTTLLGRLEAIDGERVRLAGDLADNLAAADRFFAEKFLQPFDDLIRATGRDCPAAEPPIRSDYQPPTIEALDLAAAGIGTVLWTTGYRQDFGWIESPITDTWGFVRQHHGVTEVPGLYLLGSLWQIDQTSATLFGLPRDARRLAERMGIASVGTRRP